MQSGSDLPLQTHFLLHRSANDFLPHLVSGRWAFSDGKFSFLNSCWVLAITLCVLKLYLILKTLSNSNPFLDLKKVGLIGLICARLFGRGMVRILKDAHLPLKLTSSRCSAAFVQMTAFQPSAVYPAFQNSSPRCPCNSICSKQLVSFPNTSVCISVSYILRKLKICMMVIPFLLKLN